MQSNVGRETTPEERLRGALARRGESFLSDVRPEPDLRCKADLVFPEERICIFVDGCFWHRCPDHFTPPKSNAAWWEEKLAANVERDNRQTERLHQLGWTVVRVWEHDTALASLDSSVERILVRLRGH